jgi:enoyl-CoA hydratase
MEISTDINGEVAVITMDDGKKNAITEQGLADLNAAFDKAEADAKAVVLAGRPGSFCAGFDLATMTGGDVKAIMALGQGGGKLALRLWSFPKPLVAACTGHAFTIGGIWLCSCDTRIGERGSFKIGMTETKMGMGLGGWALEPLKARLSQRLWVQSIVQARVYDPDGAVEAGFLDEVVPAGQAGERACALAAELAALPAQAYANNKLVTRGESIAVMRKDLQGTESAGAGTS